MPVLFKCCNI